MQFELKPYNRGLSDNELLDDLRSVAKQLKKDSVTQAEYDKHGRLCAATFKKRFKSWCRAHELAGLKRNRNYQATEQDCIEDIKRVAALLKTDCITSKDYYTHGKFSSRLISNRIGPWKIAVKKTGLKLSPLTTQKISDDELFMNLEQLWEKLGRQPIRKDFMKPLSLYCYGVYPKRFGTYRKALEAFIEYVNTEESRQLKNEERIKRIPKSTNPKDQIKKHETNRNINLRLRFIVMKRDNFKCKKCGRSPATDPTIVLHVDHKKAWAKGGETVLENLETLCSKCNIGKSDLE